MTVACNLREGKKKWKSPRKSTPEKKPKKEQFQLSLCIFINLWENHQIYAWLLTLVYIWALIGQWCKTIVLIVVYLFYFGVFFLHLHPAVRYAEKIVCWLALFIYICFNAHFFFKKQKTKNHKVLVFNYLLKMHNKEVLACFEHLAQSFFVFVFFWSCYYCINPVMHFFLTQCGNV